MASHIFSEPVPQPVPLLGTTWVTRGRDYQTRRVLIGLLYLFYAALSSVIAFAAWTFVTSLHASSPLLALCRVLFFVLLAASAALGVRAGLRSLRGTTSATAARPGIRVFFSRFLLLVTLPVTGPMLFGYLLGYLPVLAFSHELPQERQARLALERDHAAYAEHQEQVLAERRKYLGHE